MSFYERIINGDKNIIDLKKSVSPVILNSSFLVSLLERVNKDLNLIYKNIKNQLQYKSKIDFTAK